MFSISTQLSSHSHPFEYEQVPIHPFLGSDVSDYSSASRGLGGLPGGEGQLSEPCSLICKVCAAESKWTIGGEIPKVFGVS